MLLHMRFCFTLSIAITFYLAERSIDKTEQWRNAALSLLTALYYKHVHGLQIKAMIYSLLCHFQALYSNAVQSCYAKPVVALWISRPTWKRAVTRLGVWRGCLLLEYISVAATTGTEDLTSSEFHSLGKRARMPMKSSDNHVVCSVMIVVSVFVSLKNSNLNYGHLYRRVISISERIFTSVNTILFSSSHPTGASSFDRTGIGGESYWAGRSPPTFCPSKTINI